MLAEILEVRRSPGEPPRRWFADESHDLWIWLDEQGAPRGFQFCYGKGGIERALTWRPESGFSHHRVDSGQGVHAAFSTPMLLLREPWVATTLCERFRRVAAKVPDDIVAFVEASLGLAAAPRRHRQSPAGRRRRSRRG